MQCAQYIQTCVQNVTGKNRKEEINLKLCKLMEA
jgi:copper chaperone CopZ